MVNHIIEKQVLDVQQNISSHNYFDKISDLYYSKVIPALEKVFDEISKSGEVIRIDKLEIDAGLINAKYFERDFPARIKKAVFDKLEKLRFDSYRVYNEESVNQYSPAESRLDLILHFLETGALPWWSSSGQTENIDVIIREVISLSPGEIREFFLRNLRSEHLFRRLIFQFNDELIVEVIALFLLKKIDTIQSLVDKLMSSNKISDLKSKSKNHLRNEIYLSLFSLAKDSGVNYSQNEIYKRISEKVTEANESEYNDNQKLSGISKVNEYESAAFKEKSYINNAGLVLLFPFIVRFFENVNLVENNEFKNRACSVKAVHMLQYIITGFTDNPEYLLTLNKILCGIDVSYPIEKKVELDENDLTEAEDLLKSVIKNWTAIKNTSPEGLKESFLKRNGILINFDDKWTLKVERKTYDVLLEKVPWNYSVIKLPWMKKILYVEW